MEVGLGADIVVSKGAGIEVRLAINVTLVTPDFLAAEAVLAFAATLVMLACGIGPAPR